MGPRICCIAAQLNGFAAAFATSYFVLQHVVLPHFAYWWHNLQNISKGFLLEFKTCYDVDNTFKLILTNYVSCLEDMDEWREVSQ